MVNSGSFNTNGYSGRYLTFSWSVQSQNVAENSTTISWSLKGAGNASASYYYSGNFKVTIDGTQVYFSADRIQLYNGTTVASGTYKMIHNNSTGQRSFSASAEAGIYSIAVNCSGSGSWDLPTIPRYATATQSLSSKTETSITINWSSDSVIDYIWYSKNNGSSWTGIDVTDGKSGSYTISGLTANTAYNIKTRVRRKDSQLTTDSSPLAVTTYNYPYANSMPNFVIGNKLTIGIYNPLGRSISVYMIGANNTEKGGDTLTSTAISGYSNSEWQNFLYSTIPNAISGTYKIKVVYGNQISIKTGGTYTINTNACMPSINSVNYQDTKTATIAITGNNQQIIRNQSTVSYAANGLTTKNSATISSCKVVVNNHMYDMNINGTNAASPGSATIDSASNVVATFTLTDSRGLTATKSVTITMLDWVLPTAIIKLQRHSNFYSETDIKVDANYSSLDNKNIITIQYRYKKTTASSWSSYSTLNDNATGTFTADNNYEWNIQIVVTDRFGSTTYNSILQRGMPIIFFDYLLSSTGFNCFPKDEKSVEVNGVNIEKNVASLRLTSELTNLITNTYTKIQLTGSNIVGSKLMLDSGGIKIGNNVSKILVSATVNFVAGNTTASRYVRIIKNSYDNNNTLAWNFQTITASQRKNISITPVLVDVSPNDIIYLFYYTTNSNDIIGADLSFMTVEVIQ